MEVFKHCQGKIHIPKRLLKEGITDECHNFAFKICKDCGKLLCHNHINKDKHKCDDLVKGVNPTSPND